MERTDADGCCRLRLTAWAHDRRMIAVRDGAAGRLRDIRQVTMRHRFMSAVWTVCVRSSGT